MLCRVSSLALAVGSWRRYGRGVRGRQVRALQGARDEYRFRLKAGNGESIAVSEGYSSKAGALNGIESVRTNAPDATLDDQTNT
jgi:hypothetical protein